MPGFVHCQYHDLSSCFSLFLQDDSQYTVHSSISVHLENLLVVQMRQSHIPSSCQFSCPQLLSPYQKMNIGFEKHWLKLHHQFNSPDFQQKYDNHFPAITPSFYLTKPFLQLYEDCGFISISNELISYLISLFFLSLGHRALIYHFLILFFNYFLSSLLFSFLLCLLMWQIELHLFFTSKASVFHLLISIFHLFLTLTYPTLFQLNIPIVLLQFEVLHNKLSNFAGKQINFCIKPKLN